VLRGWKLANPVVSALAAELVGMIHPAIRLHWLGVFEGRGEGGKPKIVTLLKSSS
jgi:hypothetical protein